MNLQIHKYKFRTNQVVFLSFAVTTLFFLTSLERIAFAQESELSNISDQLRTDSEWSEYLYKFNLEEKLRSKYRPYSSSDSCSQVSVPDRAPENTVSLSFDDGPSPEYTETLLDILKQHKVKATFFLLGKRVKDFPELAAKIKAAGHLIGNHSYSHPNFHKIKLERAKKEISDTHELIKELTPQQISYFRYPYGNSTCKVNKYLENKNYISVGWHIDTCDWAFSDGEITDAERIACFLPQKKRQKLSFEDFVVSETERVGGGILLFHDIHRRTVESIGPIIERLKAKGYVFTKVNNKKIYPKMNSKLSTPHSSEEESDDSRESPHFDRNPSAPTEEDSHLDPSPARQAPDGEDPESRNSNRDPHVDQSSDSNPPVYTEDRDSHRDSSYNTTNPLGGF